MNYLILGGTGTVGSGVVRGLVEQGHSVRVLTRSEDRAKHLPKGAEVVVGDLTDPHTFERSFSGSGHLFLLNAVSSTELQEGLSALNEAKKRSYRKIVYLSIQDVEASPHIPHFASKIAIEAAIRDSRVPFVIIRPNSYLQNDYRFKDAIISHGVYPLPIGNLGVSRVDTRDVSEASVNALTNDSFNNKSFTVAGPEPWTGEKTAEQYSQVLGKEVKYVGYDVGAWYQQALQMIPAWMAYDLAIMYTRFQDEGLKATPAQMKETETILGHPPRSFTDFARELVGTKTQARAR